ncbi:MAG: hypothetical protein WCA46_06620 [Actinocatenispora sp.]
MSTVDGSADPADRPELPRLSALYPAEDLDGDHPLHPDDAFGWTVECGDRAFLIRTDADTGRHTFASFSSLALIVRMFGRHEPLGVLRPETAARWPVRLTTDESAFAMSDDEVAALLAELRAGRAGDSSALG